MAYAPARRTTHVVFRDFGAAGPSVQTDLAMEANRSLAGGLMDPLRTHVIVTPERSSQIANPTLSDLGIHHFATHTK